MTLAEVLLLAVVALVASVVGYLAAVVRAGRARDLAVVRVARLVAQLAAADDAARSQARDVAAERERMRHEFQALAAQALAANNEQFLGLAEQRLRATQVAGQADMERRELAVRGLVEPVRQTLGDLAAQVTAAEQARAAGGAALAEQLRSMRESSEQLRSETNHLVTALRSSQVRGRWGEMQLRRVVEAAGMLDRVDFFEQAHVRTADGALPPDKIVQLAGGKRVVVDAKVAFLGYLEAHQTTDDAVRAERMAAHARHVKKHIDDLAGKRYWDQFAPAPEFVVMFIPAEAFYHAALEEDGTLFEYAMERNVVIATPMTLLALLRTVAYAWRQDTLAANAQQVLSLGKELHGRISTLAAHLARLGRSLDGAAGAYNQTVASLETRVLVSARRFRDLGVVDAGLEAPEPANPQLSALSAPELLEDSYAEAVTPGPAAHP